MAVRNATNAKYKAIKDRYTQLYEVERIRLDDVIKTLCDEFYCNYRTIERATGISFQSNKVGNASPRWNAAE
jgi:hypothetical protein